MKKIKEELLTLKSEALSFLVRCGNEVNEIIDKEDLLESFLGHPARKDVVWNRLSPDLKKESEKLVIRLSNILSESLSALKNSLAITDADIDEARFLFKRIKSALKLARYYYEEPSVIHDEGKVLGIKNASQRNYATSPYQSSEIIKDSTRDLLEIFELLSDSSQADDEASTSKLIQGVDKYKKNTAFIMMWINPDHPELEDVKDTVKSVFRRFKIHANRADDIEHSGVITERIIREIKTSEFLFADLTGARPSVYYEVGYAHAIGKRVILFRKKDTQIHFDLAGYNCPEYENMRDLRVKLTKRLEAITNKKPQKDERK